MNQIELMKFVEMAGAISTLASYLADFMPDPDKAKELHQIVNKFCTLRKKTLLEADAMGDFEGAQAHHWDEIVEQYHPKEDTAPPF
jgi:hypothetical protein